MTAETLIIELFTGENKIKGFCNVKPLIFSPNSHNGQLLYGCCHHLWIAISHIAKVHWALRGLCFSMLFCEWALNCQPSVCQMRSENSALKTVL